MATPDKKRSSSRKFNLEKSGGRNFDLEKPGGRNFDLEKEEESSVGIPGGGTQEVHNTEIKPDNSTNRGVSKEPDMTPPEAEHGSGKAWIWILLAVIVVILIIWFMPKGCNSEKQGEIAPATVSDSVVIVGEVGVESDSTSVTAISDAEGNEINELTENEGTPTPSVTGESVSEAVSVSSTPAHPATESTAETQSTPVVSEGGVKSNTSVTVDGDVNEEALKVIRGEYGNGQERRKRLGSKYQEIQNWVNQLKRQGAF